MAPAHSKIVYSNENQHIFPIPFCTKEFINTFINAWKGSFHRRMLKGMGKKSGKGRGSVHIKMIWCYDADEWCIMEFHGEDFIEYVPNGPAHSVNKHRQWLVRGDSRDGSKTSKLN